MTDAQRNCQHENFAAQVAVNRLVDTGVFHCDIRVTCAQCELPFSFIGTPLGLLMTGPATSVDGLELRIPIEPGPRAIPASGEMRFEMPAKVRES